MLKTVYRSSRSDNHNCQRRDSNLGLLTPQSDALTTRLLRPAKYKYDVHNTAWLAWRSRIRSCTFCVSALFFHSLSSFPDHLSFFFHLFLFPNHSLKFLFQFPFFLLPFLFHSLSLLLSSVSLHHFPRFRGPSSFPSLLLLLSSLSVPCHSISAFFSHPLLLALSVIPSFPSLTFTSYSLFFSAAWHPLTLLFSSRFVYLQGRDTFRLA